MAGRVFAFGSAAVDFRIVTADLGENYRDKLLARQVMEFGGGSAANCLVQIARLGGHAIFLGRLGKDPLGDGIVRSLEAEGVDCTGALRREGMHSPFNLAVYAGPQKRRVGGFLLPCSLAGLEAAELDTLAVQPGPGDMVLAEIGETDPADVLALCRRAGKAGVSIAMDVDLDPVLQCGMDLGAVDALFRCADLLAPNLEAMRTLYGAADAPELARRLFGEYGCSVAVTAGADGCYFVSPEDGETRHCPAYPAEAIDTVGAGDAFHGGLLYALSRGAALSRAVELGVFCGSFNCRTFGAREGMARRADLPERFCEFRRER